MSSSMLELNQDRRSSISRLSLEVFNLKVSVAQGRGRRVIADSVSFKVNEGEFVVIVGPSGVGKSTLLRILAGLERPDSGDVYRAAVDSPESRSIGFVFQDALLLPWRRVLDNVVLGLEGLSISRIERLNRARAALALTGLESHETKWPHQLSGGERQRVGLARALAVRPALLMMDEPFSALDPGTRTGMQDELLDIWRQSGATVLFVTHDMSEAVHLADRVLVLNGRPARVDQDIHIPRGPSRQRGHPDSDELAARLTSVFISQR